MSEVSRGAIIPRLKSWAFPRLCRKRENKEDGYSKFLPFLRRKGYVFVQCLDNETFPILLCRCRRKINDQVIKDEEVVIKVLDPQGKELNHRMDIIINEYNVNRILLQKKQADSEGLQNILVPYALLSTNKDNTEIVGENNETVHFIVMPLMLGCLGDIHPRIFYRHCNEFIGQILQGLKQLHELRIIHGDIKLDNIFIQQLEDRGGGYRVKIGDFGSSNYAPMIRDGYGFMCGLYKMPELYEADGKKLRKRWKGDNIYKADIWQLGITLYELFTREHNHDEYTGTEDGYVDSVKRMVAEMPNQYLSRCILECLEKKPKYRANEETIWGYIDNENRCRARNTSGRVCKKRGYYFGYCWHHIDRHKNC